MVTPSSTSADISPSSRAAAARALGSEEPQQPDDHHPGRDAGPHAPRPPRHQRGPDGRDDPHRVAPRRAAEPRNYERGEQRHRQEGQRPLPRRRQSHIRHEEPHEAERIHAPAQDGNRPQRVHWAAPCRSAPAVARSPTPAHHAPARQPATPAPNTETPPGWKRPSSSSARAATTTASVDARPRTSGTNTARKASVTTKSRSRRRGSGSRAPATMPSPEPTFQAIYMLAPAPTSTGRRNAPLAAAMPKAPSVRNQAASNRPDQPGRVRRATARPSSGSCTLSASAVMTTTSSGALSLSDASALTCPAAEKTNRLISCVWAALSPASPAATP